MSIKTKIAAFALTALVAVGTLASSTRQADPKPFGLGWGIGAGIVGAAVVGSAIAASNDGTYGYGYRRCGWVRQFDAYGNSHGPRPHLRLLMIDIIDCSGSCVRHGRLIHPVSHPTRPVVPPGRVNFFQRASCSAVIIRESG